MLNSKNKADKVKKKNHEFFLTNSKETCVKQTTQFFDWHSQVFASY